MNTQAYRAAWMLAGLLVLAAGGCGGPEAGGGDRFGILLFTFDQPGHPGQAEYNRQATQKLTGWKDLYVVSAASNSRLFWGHYASPEAAGADLARAKAFRTPQGQALFAGALVAPLPAPPVGPPEWDAVRAPGVYTVLVAVFYDEPDANYVGRQQFAVDYCRQLRQEGEMAFYHHGPVRSMVSVGSFDESVVEKVREGKETQAVIRDDRVKAILAKHPSLAVNGREELQRVYNPKTKKIEMTPATSQLIAIPRD
jgi:hypothetical protein